MVATRFVKAIIVNFYFYVSSFQFHRSCFSSFDFKFIFYSWEWITSFPHSSTTVLSKLQHNICDLDDRSSIFPWYSPLQYFEVAVIFLPTHPRNFQIRSEWIASKSHQVRPILPVTSPRPSRGGVTSSLQGLSHGDGKTDLYSYQITRLNYSMQDNQTGSKA